MSKITPLSAARKWAAEHPDAAGELRIIATTRGGRGGWASKLLRTTAFVSGGKAALNRGVWRTRTYNGICNVCGRVFLDPVLADAHAPHPHAGEPLGFDVPGAQRAEIGELGTARACPDCISKHSLSVGYVSYGYEIVEGQTIYRRDIALPIAKYSRANDLGELDIRDAQRGVQP
jgi:hypothetical protein